MPSKPKPRAKILPYPARVNLNARPPASVLVVAQSRLLRESLRASLEALPSICVFRDTEAFATGSRAGRAAKPDVVIVDHDVVEDIGQLSVLQERYDSPAVLIITGPRDRNAAASYLQAGVKGLVDSSCSIEELAGTVERLASGEIAVSASVAAKLPGTSAAQAGRTDAKLTRRELEVAHEVAAGRSNIEIARRLGITENTVKGHLVNIFGKLGVTNRVQLAQYASENGAKAPPAPARIWDVA